MTDYEPGSFELIEFSIVDHCPYCGALFNEKGTTRDGKECTHPTRVQFMSETQSKPEPEKK